MPTSPTSGPGGGGGSVSPPVTFAGTDPDTVVLTLTGALNQNTHLLDVNAQAGAPILTLDDQGRLSVTVFDGGLANQRTQFGLGTGTAGLEVDDAGGNAVAFLGIGPAGFEVDGTAFATVFRTLDNGIVLVGSHTAPANGDLSAGECALWFDQTNGAGNTKLMVKAKSADGTVKTATILLA